MILVIQGKTSPSWRFVIASEFGGNVGSRYINGRTKQLPAEEMTNLSTDDAAPSDIQRQIAGRIFDKLPAAEQKWPGDSANMHRVGVQSTHVPHGVCITILPSKLRYESLSLRSFKGGDYQLTLRGII